MENQIKNVLIKSLRNVTNHIEHQTIPVYVTMNFSISYTNAPYEILLFLLIFVKYHDQVDKLRTKALQKQKYEIYL